MRVLFWVQRFWPHIGGVEVHSARFLRAMRERGFELTVLTSPGDLDLPATESFEGIPLHRVRFEAALSSGDPAQIAGVRRRITASVASSAQIWCTSTSPTRASSFI